MIRTVLAREVARGGVGRPRLATVCLAKPNRNTIQIAFVSRRFLASLPSHMKITLPALSPTMTEGGLAKWKKKEGEEIKVGEVLCEIETDKATVDFEFQEDGILAKRLVDEGATGLAVGCVIAIVVEDPANVGAFANSTFKDFNAGSSASAPPAATQKPQVVSLGVEELKPASAAAPAAPKKQPQQETPAAAAPPPKAPAPSRPAGERIVASPLARKLAKELNKNLTAIRGTGPSGRILAADVREAKESGAEGRPSAIPSGDHSWVMNKLNTPHYYLNVDVNLTEVLATCDLLNKSRKDKVAISANDFLIRAAGLCMKRVPEANAAWGDAGAFRLYEFCDVNVSVTAPGSGEVKTTLLKSIQSVGLEEIAEKLREATDKAGKGEVLDETPGTFSVVNVGDFGVRSIVPIIRPGQTTALGIGAQRKTLVPNESGTGAKVATISTVTLSCDHRVVDGAIGAEWLQNFKTLVEKPMSMLL